MRLDRPRITLLAASLVWVSGAGCAAPATPPAQNARAPDDGAAVPRDEAAELGPLSEAARAVFDSSAADPPAEELLGTSDTLAGKHYITSNENGLHRFSPYVGGLGGGYVGVGTDQSYLLIGWQRPELAWLFDYDPVVADVHDIYLAFFRAADDPERFLALWTARSRTEARAILDASYEGERRKRVRQTYSQYRTEIKRRLFKIVEGHRAQQIESYLWTPSQYTFVSRLVRAGRVRAMVGDLTARHGLVGIGEVARKLDVPVRVLYMSNAEEYFRQRGYSEQFRQNARAVLVDPRAVVLRTLSTYPENQDYTYVVQPGRNFLAWLERPWLRNVFQMAPRKKRTPEQVEADRYPVWLLDQEPDTSPAAAKAAQQAAAESATGRASRSSGK